MDLHKYKLKIKSCKGAWRFREHKECRFILFDSDGHSRRAVDEASHISCLVPPCKLWGQYYDLELVQVNIPEYIMTKFLH